MELSSRIATRADISAIEPLMEASTLRLQADLTPEQIAASRVFMGLDTTLIDDGTYFAVEAEGRLAGCGGWSRRATFFGADHTEGRDPRVLDPATEPARVRAMFTHPDFARRGVGRLILELCEHAAGSEGFTRLELMGTLAGSRLYAATGYEVLEEVQDTSGGVAVPILRMGKELP